MNLNVSKTANDKFKLEEKAKADSAQKGFNPKAKIVDGLNKSYKGKQDIGKVYL